MAKTHAATGSTPTSKLFPALGFDFDKMSGPDGGRVQQDIATLTAELQRLEGAGWAFVYYTTHSFAAPTKASARLFFPLTRPVLPHEWQRFWRGAVKLLGITPGTGDVNGRADNTSRFWFLPSAPEGAETYEDVHPGKPLDVDQILASEPERPDDQREPRDHAGDGERVYGPASPALIERARQRLKSHGPHRQGVASNGHAKAAMSILGHDYALTWDEAKPLAQEWASACTPAWDIARLADIFDSAPDWADDEHGRLRDLFEIFDTLREYAERFQGVITASTDTIATLKSKAIGWSRVTDKDLQRYGMLLKRVLQGKHPSESSDPDQILDDEAHAIRAVVEAAPDVSERELVCVLARAVLGKHPDEIRAVVRAFQAHAEAERDAQAAAENAAGFVETGRRYIAEHHTTTDGIVTLRRWRGGWYLWTKERGCYREISDEELDSALYRKLGIGEKKDVANQAHALIAAPHVLIPQAELGTWLDDTTDDPLDMCVCRNGIVHLPSGTLRPATPAYFHTSCMGVDFDPKAPVPKLWLKFLSEVFPDDPTAIVVLQEIIGYLLSPDTRQHKLFLFLGLKRSGKGTVARIICALLGVGNFASPTLSALAQQFGKQSLIGKAVAIIGDARLTGRSPADLSMILENLLGISGEDSQTVPRKNREDYIGRMMIRFLILTNLLPSIPDPSDALTDRTILLHFRQSFLGREDTELTSKLLGELPGILNWAIEGWKRQRDRGHFDQAKTSEAALDQLRDSGNPVGAWLRDCCDVDKAKQAPTREVFTSYRRFCADRGLPLKSDHELGVDLTAMGYQRTRKRDEEGKRVPHYAGFALKEPATAEAPVPLATVAGTFGR